MGISYEANDLGPSQKLFWSFSFFYTKMWKSIWDMETSADLIGKEFIQLINRPIFAQQGPDLCNVDFVQIHSMLVFEA